MKLTTTQSKRMQVLRGLAIIAVVFIHNTPNQYAHVFIRPFFNFAVGLFLFFSGMLSSAEKWNPKKRIIKVIIPYVLWSLIYTIMYNIRNVPSIPIEFLKNVITGNAATMMYYVFVYCEFTLLIPLIDKLANSKFKYWGFAVTPIEIIVMRVIPLITGQEIHVCIRTIMNISCLGWFTYFYLGYLLGNKVISINIVPKKIILFWIFSIFIQMAEGFGYYTLGYQNCGTQLKLTSIVTGVLFALMAYDYVLNGKEKNIKVLRFLGDHSFGIYFSHLAVMRIIRCIPFYERCIPYPITAIISIVVTTFFVLVGKRILGKYSKHLAL